MAQAKQHPIADPHRGRASFAEDLPRVLAGRTLDELGWIIPNPLTLLVPVVAGAEAADDYLLRLGFQYYPEWPPSTLFVNPRTLEFDRDRDLYWLPKVEGDNGFAVHRHYSAEKYSGQLICSSVSLQFYLVLHDVKTEHVWNSTRHTFGATVSRVQEALRSSHYKGRHSDEKPRDVGYA